MARAGRFSVEQLRAIEQRTYDEAQERIYWLRKDGASWTDIGQVLGVPRATAHRRWRHVDDLVYEERSAGAESFLEMDPGEFDRLTQNPGDYAEIMALAEEATDVAGSIRLLQALHARGYSYRAGPALERLRQECRQIEATTGVQIVGLTS